MMRSIVALAPLLILPFASADAAQAQSVSECVENLVKQTRFVQESTVDVTARADPPEWRCRTIRVSGSGCVRAVEGFALVGAPAVRRINCNRGRCSAYPVRLEESDGKTVAACLTVRAWSGNGCFAPGGWAHFQLTAQSERAMRVDEFRVIEKVRKPVGPTNRRLLQSGHAIADASRVEDPEGVDRVVAEFRAELLCEGMHRAPATTVALFPEPVQLGFVGHHAARAERTRLFPHRQGEGEVAARSWARLAARVRVRVQSLPLNCAGRSSCERTS